jgi:hypothetical protein
VQASSFSAFEAAENSAHPSAFALELILTSPENAETAQGEFVLDDPGKLQALPALTTLKAQMLGGPTAPLWSTYDFFLGRTKFPLLWQRQGRRTGVQVSGRDKTLCRQQGNETFNTPTSYTTKHIL